MTLIYCRELGDDYAIYCQECRDYMGIVSWDELTTMTRLGYVLICMNCQDELGWADTHHLLDPEGMPDD